MKTNSRHEVIARIARESLGLAALLALMLSAAGASRAQSMAAATRVAPANTTPATQAGTPKPAAAPTAPKGQHEGIMVHGHWVIEVKNPDGTVTARREFENSIQPYGAGYLAALLSGNNSPGGLSILLNGVGTTFGSLQQAGSQPLTFSEAGPCLPLSYPGPLGGTTQGSGPSTGTTCLITNSTSLLTFVCELAQEAAGTLNVSSPSVAISPCSTNLAEVAPAFPSGGTSSQLVLSGSVTATSTLTGQMVNDVETVFTTCDVNSTPNNCVDFFDLQTASPTSTGASPVALNLFTERPLDGNTTAGAAAGDPNPVSYATGQVIAVTVTFSFQ